MSATLIVAAPVVNEGDILAYRLPSLRLKVEGMNKKAEKLGKTALVLTHGERFVKAVVVVRCGVERKENREFVHVQVQGERPVLSGWVLAGVKEVMPNGEMLLKVVPGVEVPESYRNAAYGCEHCQMNRMRRELVIVKNVETGEFKQVGKTCLQDFLGGCDIDGYLAYYSMIAEVLAGCGDDEGYCAGRKDEGWFDPTDFLTVASAAIRHFGWMPASKARDEGKTATSALVGMALRNRHDDEKRVRAEIDEVLNDADVALAGTVLAWARGISQVEKSGYLYNLGVAARQESITYETAGLMASAIPAYQKAQEKAQVVVVGTPKVHVGTVGNREVFEGLTVTAVRCFDGEYGVRTLVRF